MIRLEDIINQHIQAQIKCQHFADDTFKSILLNWDYCIFIQISLIFVSKGPTDYTTAIRLNSGLVPGRKQCKGKVKGKVTVLSPHPGSELCSADFDKYLPWSLGLLLSISVWITISTPWGVYSRRSHATWRKGLQICPHRYPFPPGSREAMQREVPCSGAQRAVASAGYWTRDLT